MPMGSLLLVDTTRRSLKGRNLPGSRCRMRRIGGLKWMGSRLERILVVKPMPCTSLITGPKDIKAIAQEIGAQPTITGKYTVDCEKVAEIPSITWTIAGKEYEVDGKYLVIQSSGMCIFAMMGMDFAEPGPKWILSDVFMRQYHTLFDYEGERVGFAPAV